MVEVRAAGGVVWRPTAGGVEILLVHRPKYDDWSLPKGKADRGERDEDTALREVAEETGFDCELGPELARISYFDHDGRSKSVRYWAMTIKGPASPAWHPNDEVDEIAWMDVDAARGRLSYTRDVAVLDAFVAAA